MEKEKLASLLLRLGLAFSFFYAAISAFINPTSWIGFLPEFLRGGGMLTAFSISEIILGLWLLSGWKTFYSSVLSAIVIAGITVFNFGSFDIVFRDVSILLMAIALAVLSKGK